MFYTSISEMEIQRLSANDRKYISGLSSARRRREECLFVAEGGKCVAELSPFFSCKWLVATDAWLMEHGRELPAGMPVWKARADELERMSQMRTPQGVLAVFAIPDQEAVAPVGDELYIALDRVQDPGNLGTIIRLADWFGISRIYASSDTVDVFNSKVVQSTMGGLARVAVQYCDLPRMLEEAVDAGIDVYGTFLGGENLYTAPLTRGGIIVMGNEGQGISPEVEALCGHRLTIPPFPAGASTVESLNVSVATAVAVAEFRRRIIR